jgi:hypothetical protein
MRGLLGTRPESRQGRLGRGLNKCPRWVLPLCAALALEQRAAGAEPEHAIAEAPASFRWSFVRLAGAESCPGAERIAAGVRSRLGRDPFANDADRNIEGSVVRDGQVWRAHLSVIGPEGAVLGSRELQSSEPDCTTLADAVTLAVALVIDPRAAFAPPSAEPVPPVAATPPATPLPVPVEQRPPVTAMPATAPPPPLPVAPAPADSPLAASLRGALALGLLPRAAFGVESAGEVRLAARFSLSVGVSYFPEVSTSDGGFAFGLSAAFVGLCVGTAQTRAARLAVCAEGQLGAMHAVVYSVRPLPPGDHLWGGARVGPRLRLLLGGALWLEAGGMAQAPLVRHAFVLKDEQDPVFQSSPLTFVGTLGLSASIR